MAWSLSGRNKRAAATAALVDAVSLHTADPGEAGTANEWSSGGYERKAPSFGSPSGGVVTASPIDFSGPASTTAAYVGLWDDGDFLGAVPRGSGDVAANAAGEYTVTGLAFTGDGTITAS